MKETDKMQMYVNIAGEHISLNVDFNSQDEVREAEASVCELYNQWKERFPRRSKEELLAMISYQFAYYYQSLQRRFVSASTEMAELDARLNKLLSESDD